MHFPILPLFSVGLSNWKGRHHTVEPSNEPIQENEAFWDKPSRLWLQTSWAKADWHQILFHLSQEWATKRINNEEYKRHVYICLQSGKRCPKPKPTLTWLILIRSMLRQQFELLFEILTRLVMILEFNGHESWVSFLLWLSVVFFCSRCLSI